MHTQNRVHTNTNELNFIHSFLLARVHSKTKQQQFGIWQIHIINTLLCVHFTLNKYTQNIDRTREQSVKERKVRKIILQNYRENQNKQHQQ